MNQEVGRRESLTAEWSLRGQSDIEEARRGGRAGARESRQIAEGSPRRLNSRRTEVDIENCERSKSCVAAAL